ncbi:MAG: oligopeptide/dipeptide ABC transporter ATP-binding protein, partial [Spirochaetota bacterium]
DPASFLPAVATGARRASMGGIVTFGIKQTTPETGYGYLELASPALGGEAAPLQRFVEKPILQGEIPSPVNPPSGCRFRTRCPYAAAICAEAEPALAGGVRKVACHFPLE